MKLPQVRISTLILSIAIVALLLTIVVQRDMASRREALLRGRLKQMAIDVRDATNREVKIREDIVLGLLQANRSKTDPEVEAAIAEMQKTQAEFIRRVDQLKSLR
jgi:hypothetical protein